MAEHLESEHDDERVRQLLQRLDADAAPIDAELLARLRESSLRELDAVSANEKTQAATESSSTNVMVQRSESQAKGRRMFALAARAVIGVTTLAFAGFFLFFSGDHVEADSLGQILDATRQARTLHLQVVRNGEVADIWMKQDGRLRWQTSPTSYRIANGTSLWEIDEEANIARRSDDEMLASAATGLDLLALLEIDEKSASILRKARPSGNVNHHGAECRVYQTTTSVAGRELTFEAFVDSQTNQLRDIVAWPAGRPKRVGPPVAELRFVALNADVDDAKFEFAESLSEDGRIGKVTDRQGIVLLRPKLYRRWTPICKQMRLKPGDQLRTDVRGANAVAARLTSGATITVGPGTLAELISPKVIRLHYGELQVADGKKSELEIRGALDESIQLEGDDAALYQIGRDRKLAIIPNKPVWLLGFEGASTNESIGSLITKVDGRDVPLTIGYHKVKVEIRDQIARTTIEESFVNRTKRRLEGIFHFPLPQDASISGFGMWINGELVEADVVEKQRAREIYETILRERRDPGLLEWTGGNIFKARVFPIEPHSEKRIKIVYTQVLPLRANQYRYSYALRSEMLLKTPLRELSIDVLVNSALPLKKVESPTHAVRIEQTERSARVQFTAQEYSPTRDFELVCDIDGRASDVVTIPHRRGDDGYFMMQLMPPAAEGNWQREVLPDGEPLEVLLVCDTSGSMDKANRKTQAEFVASVLTSLGPDDRFNIAVCDADCKWLFEKPVSPEDENVQGARTWLSERISLGWTDLDAAFESIQQRVRKKSHVVYVGDGVVSARDVNAQDFAARVRRLYSKKSRGTFHAVSTGSSFESVVLKAIASLGRGSVRSIGSGQTPMSIALELLNEIAQPGLRDLNVEFRGVQVAAVYPEELPNLAAGTQQILIGRYLPTGDDQAGEIVVSGTRGRETVTYSAKIPLKDAENGNSFVPRLWARAHLDHLLQQGSSTFIKDEIIGLSEEFHIITPYTSLLVLETDEDRERFGVKRRFEMRDGERFFADGRDAANYELTQKVIREAGNWRLGLRYQVLRQLAQLGRDLQAVQELKQLTDQRKATQLASAMSSSRSSSSRSNWFMSDGGVVMSGSLGGGFAGGMGGGGGFGGRMGGELAKMSGVNRQLFVGEPMDSSGPGGGPVDKNMSVSLDELDFEDGAESKFEMNALMDVENRTYDTIDRQDGRFSADLAKEQSNKPLRGLGAFGRQSRQPMRRGQLLAQAAAEQTAYGAYGWNGQHYSTPNYVAWLQTIFPHLPAAPPKILTEPEPKKSEWPDEAIALSESLLRNDWLAELEGGLEIRGTNDSHDARWKRQTGHSDSLDLYSPNAWLTWSVSGGNGKTINWYDEKQRGAISETYSLGRARKSEPTDRRKSIEVGDHTFGYGLHESYRTHDVEIINGAGVKQLMLTHSSSPQQTFRISIDTEKNLVVKFESLLDGKLNWAKTHSDFVEIQGTWLPTKWETVDAKGRVTAIATTKITELTDAEFAARHSEELAIREQIEFLHHPVPTIEEAETAEADGSANFEDRLALIVRSSQIQKWDEVMKQLAELDELVGDKAGKHWIRLEILKSARRNAEALDLIHEEAAKFAEAQPADLTRAQHLLNSTQKIGNANETLKLLLDLKPVYDRQPDYSAAKWTWRGHQINGLRALSRTEELLALEKTHAEEQPWSIHVQTQYARDLATFGNHEAGYEWLKAIIARGEDLHPQHERDQVWRTWADMLQQQGESAAQIEVVKQWLDDEPESEQPYSRYLASLAFDDRMDEVREVTLKWMEEGRIEGELSPPAKARTGAAINYAMGQAWNMYYNVVTPDWYEPLQTTALYFMQHEHHFDFTSRVMDRHQFSNTDAADVVRVRMFEELQESAATMKPNVLAAYVRWVRGGKPDEDVDDWKPIAEVLRQRWDDAQHTDEGDDEKHAIGDSLSSIYASFFKETEYFPFLRERIARANERWRDQYVIALFNVLITREWTEEIEVEMFSLLAEISKNVPATQLSTQVESAHRLVDRLLAARAEADQKQLQDTGHPEQLTRQELAAKKAEFQTAAREGVAARLAEESPKHDGLLGQWLQIERMYLDVRLKRNIDEVAAECIVILGDKPPVPRDKEAEADDESTAEELAIEATDEIVRAALRQRALITYTNLAVRKSAEPELRRWLMAYVDAGIEDGGDNSTVWKTMKYNLLVALDEPQQLEQVVRTWIQDDEYVTGWRRLLARLSAERGEIDEAIDLFEKIEKDSQLGTSDYAALAAWYLARDQKEDFRRAKVESLKAAQEYQLSNYVSQRQYRWQDRSKPLPSELDEQVLFAFQALFEKSSSPGNYLYQLRGFYKACRDFRLLNMLPDSVVGRTPQQVYDFLGRLRTTALAEVRKESTADEILARVEELRQRDLTTIDLRALDLMEALVERQSAEVLNQPGPHIEAAVAALQRAFDREWADGEGRQMAKLLDSLGQLKQAGLAAEQSRQLEALYAREEPGTDDRLFVGWHLANSMFNPYGKRAEGLQRMEIVIREYEQTHADGWPAHANAPLGGYVQMLERVNRHAEAEVFVKKHLEKPINAGQRKWMMERLTSVYASALEAGTRVSLGEKAELYRNLIPFIVKQAERGDDNHRYQVLQRLESVFRTAKRKGFPTLRKDMRKFAFTTLPRLLKRQRNNYRTLVDTWSHRLNELLDPRTALEFLIERIENYPQRLVYSWENPWQQFGYRLGDWRKKAGNLGELEPRLLAIVLAELRRDLETRNQRSRYLYQKNSYFWDAKEADFAKLAEKILADHRDSERSVRYIAEYFWRGLKHRSRAIEILFVALKDDLLDDSGKAILVDWLHHHEVKRYAESIAILEGLIERHHVHMHYRCELITAYHQTGRGEQRAELTKETIELFRQGGRWNESNLSQLAACAHFNHLNQRTVELSGELIPMHQRSHPTRGIGQGTLSNYYTWLADAHSNLKQTKEAVDAAAAAIVSWGPAHSQRRYAVNRLDAVTQNAKDLDDYVGLIDKRAEDTGQDSSIIRRSIGRAYGKRNEHKKAITQLQISIELQPGDLDTHKLLMASYDTLKDKKGAVQQLLALINVDRHNLSHYVDVEKRLRDDEELAERAATAIVEASPNEAEYHEALAKIRTAKKQHTAAVVHWQQVAELRSLEPNGLINLAKAQLQANQPQAADKTITRLQKTDWPSRFENDVRNSLNEINRLKQSR
jgi:outer membrane lipoprotein-sorting protein